jgi:transmembrane sensor
MNNNNTINDGLLVKYLMNEATAEEVQQVETWLSDSKENQQYFNTLQLIWEESASLAEGSEEEESAAWTKLENRLNLNTPVVPKRRIFNTPLLRIAAIVVLICGLGWFASYYFRNPVLLTLQSHAGIIHKVLPDGSEITLNKNSEIIYSSIFRGKNRPVKLTGEAFFKVSPDKEKPFIITVNEITVKVVGTTFNVKNRNKKTVVVVETGIVQVSRGNKTVELHAGEQSIIDKDQTGLYKEKNRSKLYNYYRTNELECEHTPLQELVDILNEIHHKNIVISTSALKNKEITADFKNQSLEEIIQVIKETFKIQVEYKNQQILLK